MFALEMNVSVLVNIILEHYFGYQRCLMIVKDQESNLTYKGKHQIVEISIEDNFNHNSSLIDQIILSFEYGCGGFVIDTEEPAEIFEYIEEKIRLSFVRYNRRRYLIIVRKNIGNFKEMFSSVSGLRFVYDLLFLVELNSLKYQLWSFDISGDEDTITFQLLDTWINENNASLRSNLYPDKLQNQHGRVLRLACFSYPPYTNCGNHTKIEGLFGTELILALEFANLHNMTPKFVFNQIEEELWGALYPNWTGLGLMGRVLRDEADIAFTAFFIWEFVNQYLDMSMPYLRSGITCLVPKPDILDGWLTPILSFQVSLWLAVIINFILNAFSLFFLTYRRKHKKNKGSTNSSYPLLDSFWIVLTISLGQTHQSEKNSSRIIFSILFLAYLILNSTYFCGLASIMTIPRYEDPIDSLTSLANSDVEIRGIFEDWILSIKEIKEEPYTKIVEHYRAASEEELRELSKEDNYAFFMERLSYNNYGINDFIKDDVIENYHLMKGDVFWEYTEFFLRKSSVLGPRFDMFILHVLQSGLPSYWQKKAVNHLMDPRVQKIATMMEHTLIKQDEVVKLKLSHIEGCYGFLFMGYFLSATVLIMERLIHCKRGIIDK